MTGVLALRQLHKTFPDGTRAVKGIDLDIERGEFTVLLGPSGCGKTTTLRMIAGLETPTSGSITLDGRDVTNLRGSQRDVGFVFQFYALYPHLSVRQNIAFPLLSVGTPARDIEARVGEAADRLGLAALLDRHPAALSGGDQQRVALARAMVRRPRLWLMDEPLGTLDADQRIEMREFIRCQQTDMKITSVYVTHDQEEAMSLADRIVVMDQGVIRQVGTPHEVYNRPANLFVANFVGSPGMNFIEGRIEPGGSLFAGPLGKALASSRSIQSGPVTLGIRPEHVLVSIDGLIPAKVIVSEYLGAFRLLHVESELGRLVVRTDESRASVLDSIRLDFDRDHLNFFHPATGNRL